MLRSIGAAFPAIEPPRLVHELVRRLITRMIEDVIAESRRRLAALAPASADDVRRATAPVVGFSPEMAEADKAIKGFLFPRMYRHERVMRIMGEAEDRLGELFVRYMQHPHDLPPEWQARPNEAGARRIADFIAGMTDRYALMEHARLFGTEPELG
jgi:dGTPase